MGRLFTSASSHRIQVGSAGLGGLDWRFGTMAVCCQFTTLGGDVTILSINAASAEWYMAGQTPTMFNGSDSAAPTTIVLTATPVLLAVTKATGTIAPRSHYYRFSTGVWLHEAMNTAIADAPANTALTIGSESDAASQLPLNGEIWALGMWPGYAMSDLEVERLAAGDWGRRNPGFWDQWDTSRDNADMATTLGRYPVKQTARTGATRGTLAFPGGFRMSPVRHRR